MVNCCDSYVYAYDYAQFLPAPKTKYLKIGHCEKGQKAEKDRHFLYEAVTTSLYVTNNVQTSYRVCCLVRYGERNTTLFWPFLWQSWGSCLHP